ncbi:hypothetical protein CC79DRAFT_1370172 [Sarocladium strictum]
MAAPSTEEHHDSLYSFKYNSLPLGAIKPQGWLHDQISLSAEGLGGHLFDFYRYVNQSLWLGGEYEYSELKEAGPYWFNYIVPLAWTLDDNRLKAQAKAFLDYNLDNQAEDGWLGPEKTRQDRGIWARSLLAFGLTQYAEADSSETDRIVTALHKFVNLAHDMLQNNFTGLLTNKELKDNFDPWGFGVSRTHELPISLMWLYENHPRGNQKTILETIDLMFEGGRVGGRDWTKFFVDGVFPKDTKFKSSGFTHGVNLAQGLRYPSVLHRRTKNESLIQQTHDAVDMVMEYHTSLSGTIIGDEHLGGLNPQRGSELCMAVESMFSYAYLYRYHGTNLFADRAELAAFNALPAAMSPDWWSHQYVTQTNQPWSRNLTENPYFNVAPNANTYGLEPNFPCCTVNHPQAYPKYVSGSFATEGQKGLIHMLLGPLVVETEIGGKPVKVDVKTNYPFAETLDYTITSKTDFDFSVRIPQWTDKADGYVKINNLRKDPLRPNKDGLHRFQIKKGITKIEIFIPMEISVVTRNETVGIYRGPILYASISNRKPLPDNHIQPMSKDHTLTPISNWKFAIDPRSIKVKNEGRHDRKLPNPIFSRENAPVSLEVDAYPIDWPITLDTAALPPVNPVAQKSEKQKLKLIPFAAAKLHIAQFPVAKFE